MSIVLVAIALIVAAIIGGQSLVKQSRLQKVVTEANNYKIAIKSFKLQYNNYMPGDFPNAWAYWKTGCADLGSGRDPALQDEFESGCNGNGNGILDGQGTNQSGYILAWRHLSLAGLIPDKFTISEDHEIAIGDCGHYGDYGGCPMQVIPGSKAFERRGWSVGHTSDSDFVWGGSIHGYVGHALIYGTHICDGCWHYTGASLSAQDAAYIDKKTDDGMPTSGKVQADQGWDGWAQAGVARVCRSAPWPSASPITYKTTETEPGCQVYFLLDY